MSDWKKDLGDKFSMLSAAAATATAVEDGPPARLLTGVTGLVLSPELQRTIFDAIRQSLEGGTVEFYSGTQPAHLGQALSGDAKLRASLPIQEFYEWCGTLWACTALAPDDSDGPLDWILMLGADGQGVVLGAIGYFVDAGQLRLRVA